MPTLTLNSKVCEVAPGLTLLHAARRAGIDIPTLCHDDRFKPIGGCRLCLVKVVGHDKPVTACNTPVANGMVVETHTPELEDERRALLAWMARHYSPGAVTASPDKPFHQLLQHYGVTARGEPVEGAHAPFRDDTHPHLRVDMARCILCFRCVHICADVQGQFVWHALGRGDRTVIVPGNARSLLESDCTSCGACADTCPTGAIDDRTESSTLAPEHWTRTTCPYCGVGCELELGTRANRVVRARPVIDAPVNRGHLCVKGHYAFAYNAAPDRLTTPLLREQGRWREASWTEAFTFIARRIEALRTQHGSNTLAVLGSARASNEENYLAQKFARLVLGTNNVDSCARVCHTPTAAAMKMMLGTGAATNSYDDIERARLILVCGSNATENHPIVGARIKQAVRRGAQLIVVDPRRTELAALATLHIALTPGSNVPLFNALAHVIVEEGLFDASYVRARVAEFDHSVAIENRSHPPPGTQVGAISNRDDFRTFIHAWTPERAAPICGVEPVVIREAARLYAAAKPALMVHGLGMTEHVQGTEGVMTLVNLALLTGNIGVAGGGVNPLRGQNNVQGAAHMGCDPGTLTGGVSIDDARDRFAAHWGAPLPERPGLNMLRMMDAAEAGKLKALWCIGYDIYFTNANAAATRRALGNLELLVVQDLFMNETAREFAHVVLPAASSFEKDGTFMNAERRIQRIRRAVNPPGQARSDWEILCDAARVLGQEQQFAYTSAQDIWDEIRRVWPGAGGISYERIESHGLQWPCPDEQHPGTTLLHRDQFNVGARAALRRIEYHASPEHTDPEFPFVLITGRTLHQFNAGTMTTRASSNALRATDTLDMAPADAQHLGLRDGTRVRVRSRYGEATLPLRISVTMKPGELFATFHDPAVFINQLTSPHRDRFVQAPEYKRTAVRVESA